MYVIRSALLLKITCRLREHVSEMKLSVLEFVRYVVTVTATGFDFEFFSWQLQL